MPAPDSPASPANPPAARVTPPAAHRIPHVLNAHGDDRSDDWYWLRDRDDPDVIAYLEADNQYADAAPAPLAPLRERRLGVGQAFAVRVRRGALLRSDASGANRK